MLSTALFTIMSAMGSSNGNRDAGWQPNMLFQNSLNNAMAPRRVDVTLGVMSKCPDALFFENAFSRTLDQVNNKISLSLTYIASPNSSETYGAQCKHGTDECAGNIHQLCVINALNPTKAGKRYDIGPSQAQRLWWEFIQCENFVGGVKHIGEESLAKQCTDALGKFPKWEDDGIKDCIRGGKGTKLLHDSIEKTIARHIV